MTEGARVVRISLRSDEGTLDERGTVRRRYDDHEGQPFGYYVEWDQTTSAPIRITYVAPVRITSLDEWQRHQAQRSAV